MSSGGFAARAQSAGDGNSGGTGGNTSKGSDRGQSGGQKKLMY